MKHTKNLKDMTFGRLTVLGPAPTKGYWRVKCICGNEKPVRGASLTSGNTRSCGCLTKHNPGRPKRQAYAPHIPFGTFVQDTFEHMAPLRDALARHGVVINGKGDLRYAGRVEQYETAYHALAHALLKTLKV